MNTITAISRVTLSKFLNFSLPHFSHPQNGGNYNTQQIFLKIKKEACRSAQPPKITHNTFSVSIGFIVVLRNWKCQSLSHAQLFSTPWTAVCQAPLFMGFSGQDYWSRLPFTSLGDLPKSGTEPRCPAMQANSLPSELLSRIISLDLTNSYWLRALVQLFSKLKPI